MFYTIVAIVLSAALALGVMLHVARARSASNGFSASLLVFAAALAAGIGWAAAFLTSASIVASLITVAAGGSLDQLFSLTGSVPAQIAKYVALVLAIGLTVVALSCAFIVGSNRIRADRFIPDGPFGSWLDAAPSWLQGWESRVARPLRDAMDRVRIAGVVAGV